MSKLLRPCSKCGRPTRVSPCPAHGPRVRHPGRSRQARGFDAEYDRNRAEMLRRTLAALQRGELVRCQICRRQLTLSDRLTCEHITPRRQGGSNALDNLAPAHASCNYGWRKGRAG